MVSFGRENFILKSIRFSDFTTVLNKRKHIKMVKSPVLDLFRPMLDQAEQDGLTTSKLNKLTYFDIGHSINPCSKS